MHSFALILLPSQDRCDPVGFWMPWKDRNGALAAVSKKQFNVSISRARERVRVYTDDVELLATRVESTRTRKSAVELRDSLPKNWLNKVKAKASNKLPSDMTIKKQKRAVISKRLSLILKVIELGKYARKWVTNSVEKIISDQPELSAKIAQIDQVHVEQLVHHKAETIQPLPLPVKRTQSTQRLKI